MNEQLARLREWFDKLQPRERRLVSWLAMALIVFFVLLVPLGASMMLGSRREGNRALREASAAVKNAREDVRQRQAKREAIAQRYANRPPPLAGVLEKAARENHLDIPESQDRPEVPHGKKYVERTTVVRLRKASMLQIAKMLESLEQQHMPLSVSRLNIRRRGGERDSYDVELGLSAYDRNEAATTSKPSSPAGSGK
jgi:type II secretory pathway component PulM